MINPVLLIAFPLLFSFVPTIFKKWEKPSLILITLFNLMGLFFMHKGVYNIGGWTAPYGINLVLDDYSYFGIVVVNFVFAGSLLLSFESVGKYSIVLLISLAALNGMLLTGDLFNLFVFLEIAAIAAYLLASMTQKYKYAFSYLVIGTLGSGLFLFGTIILYGIFGSLNMMDIHTKLANSLSASPILILPAFLIFTGLAVEAKLLPFNGWVKGVMGNANGLVGSLFASAYAAAIILVIGRLFTKVLILPDNLRYLLIGIAIATLILGEFAAFSKKSVREILLFSSIAQSGLVITLFLSGLAFPALLQLLNNVVAKLIMFTIAGNLVVQTGTDQIENLRGIFRKHNMIGFGFSAAALSIIGLPLFYGFYVKVNILVNLFASNNLWLPGIILLTSIVEGTYFVRLITQLWNPGEEGVEANSMDETKLSFQNGVKMGLIVSVIGILIIAAGIFPYMLVNNVRSAANTVADHVPVFFTDVSGVTKK